MLMQWKPRYINAVRARESFALVKVITIASACFEAKILIFEAKQNIIINIYININAMLMQWKPRYINAVIKHGKASL